jgi:hypothetical protein
MLLLERENYSEDGHGIANAQDRLSIWLELFFLLNPVKYKAQNCRPALAFHSPIFNMETTHSLRWLFVGGQD